MTSRVRPSTAKGYRVKRISYENAPLHQKPFKSRGKSLMGRALLSLIFYYKNAITSSCCKQQATTSDQMKKKGSGGPQMQIPLIINQVFKLHCLHFLIFFR